MIDPSVTTAVEKLTAGQADLRTAVGAAASDPAVPIKQVKELTSFHDQVNNIIREITNWQKANVATPVAKPAAV